MLTKMVKVCAEKTSNEQERQQLSPLYHLHFHNGKQHGQRKIKVILFPLYIMYEYFLLLIVFFKVKGLFYIPCSFIKPQEFVMCIRQLVIPGSRVQ